MTAPYYADLPPREQIAAIMLDRDSRCDACGEARTTVRECEVPGGLRFKFCPDCRAGVGKAKAQR